MTRTTIFIIEKVEKNLLINYEFWCRRLREVEKN